MKRKLNLEKDMNKLNRNIQDSYGTSSYNTLKNAKSKNSTIGEDILEFLDSIQDLASPEKENQFVEYCLKQGRRNACHLKAAA